MFESVAPDPGERGLLRAAIIFYAIAVLTGLGLLTLIVTGSPRLTPVRIVVYLLFIVLAVVTGRGIDNQRRWAKWVGYGFGALELISFPIGTVIGIAILVYIHRASRAGLFVT